MINPTPQPSSLQKVLAVGNSAAGSDITNVGAMGAGQVLVSFNQPTLTQNNEILRNSATGGSSRVQLSVASDGGTGLNNGLTIAATPTLVQIFDHEGRTFMLGPAGEPTYFDNNGNATISGGLTVIGEGISLPNLPTSPGSAGTLWNNAGTLSIA